MGSDQHVDPALERPAQHVAHLARFSQRADHFDRHRVPGEALLKRLVVLVGEQGGGDEDRHLLLVEHRLEGGAHRDLGLAVADVAADEAIHHLGLEHVGQHLVDRALLIRRLVELEVGFELAEVPVRLAEAVAGVRAAGGVELEQIGRHLQQLLADAGFGLDPRIAAQLVELDLVGISAGEARDEPHPPHGQVDLVLAEVLEQQEVVGDSLQLHLRQAAVPRDAEFGMDDEVSFLQISKRRGAKPRVALAALGGPPGPGAEDLFVRQHRDPAVFVDEALRDLADEHVREDAGKEEGRGVGRQRLSVHLHRRLALGQQPLEAVGLPRGAAGDGGDDPLVAPLVQAGEQRSERSFFAVVAGDRLSQIPGLPEREGHRRLGLGRGGQGQRARFEHWQLRQRGEHFCRAQKVGLRWKGQLASRDRVGVAALGLGPAVFQRLVHRVRVVDEHQRRAGGPRRQVVEERGEPAIEEAWQEPFEPGAVDPFADLIDSLAHPRGGDRGGLGERPEILLGAAPGRLAEEQLSRGKQSQLGNLRRVGRRSLRLGLERPH